MRLSEYEHHRRHAVCYGNSAMHVILRATAAGMRTFAHCRVMLPARHRHGTHSAMQRTTQRHRPPNRSTGYRGEARQHREDTRTAIYLPQARQSLRASTPGHLP